MNSIPGWLKASLVLAVLALLAGGTWFYRSQERQLRQEVEGELDAIGHLKADQIVDWRSEELGHGCELTLSLFLPENVTPALADRASEPARRILRRFRGLQAHCLYHDMLMADVGGKVWLSLSGRTNALGREDTETLAAALREGRPVLSDLHTDEVCPSPHVDTAAPLFAGEGENHKLVGVAMLVCEAKQDLFPLIQSWHTSNRTAETLLVRSEGNDVVVLNELRHSNDTALKLRFPVARTNLPCAMAVLGKDGVVQQKDYRGVKVVAALHPILDSPWSLVVKMDAGEAFAVWQFRSVMILALLFALVALVGTAMLVVWQRNEKAHYQTLYQAEAARLALEERHGTILKSIGDAVVATDAQGNVELLNPVAEALTGWTTGEARGKPLEEVFRIINEETRRPAENPVRRVMREGVVVGLANHTVLLARNGAERAIVDSGAPIRDDKSAIIGVVLVFRDQTEERALQRALEQSEARLAEAQRIAHVGSWQRDLATGKVWWSAEMYRIFGLSPEEFEPTHGRALEFVHAEDRPRVAAAVADAVAEGRNYELEYRLCLRDGTERAVAVIGHVERDPDGRAVRTQGVTQDITERQRAEVALHRLNRELRAITNCNQALLRATDEPGLLKDLCRILCDEAGYRMAWVGYGEHDDAKSLRPVAWAGVEDGYLTGVNITWTDTERGRGPTGTAMRRGTVEYVQDFATDPRVAPWRAPALQRGYRSSIALPLKGEDGGTFGVFTIYSKESNAFTPAEIRLLEDLAGDLAFGITVLRARAERKRAAAELRQQAEELRSRNEELTRFNQASVGRELRMIELKKEINELCRQAGQPPRFALEFAAAAGDPSGTNAALT